MYLESISAENFMARGGDEKKSFRVGGNVQFSETPEGKKNSRPGEKNKSEEIQFLRKEEERIVVFFLKVSFEPLGTFFFWPD